MTKTNDTKRRLQEERGGSGQPNPFMYTEQWTWWGTVASIVTLPGKVPHRICRGRA